MPLINPEDPADFVPYEALDQRQRDALVVRLKEQFTEAAAVRICDLGRAELGAALLDAPGGCTDGPYRVQFTPSAHADWTCFRDPGTQTIDELRTGVGAGPDVERLPRTDCFLLRRGPMRWVYHRNITERRVVVFGLGVWAINPVQKVWRYLSQNKAEDLLRTSELYLRRLDRLQDEFEATPTFAMFEDHRRHLLGTLGFAADHHLDFFEHLRRATYVSCWQKSEPESFAMWKGYCPDDDGMAVQTTERRLHHEHRRICRERNHFHLRSVRYVDHRTDAAFLCDISDPAFLKAEWYADEKELRFAAVRVDAAAAGAAQDTELRLAALPVCERIPINLEGIVERVVFNPFAPFGCREALLKLMRRHRPLLESRIIPSALENVPASRSR